VYEINLPKSKVLFCLLISFICCLPPAAFAGIVKLKMIVANPSSTVTKTLPVKTFLPKGIKPEDITEKGKFEIGYDFEKSLYYAYQDLTLDPDESVTLELTLRDIWSIPEKDISSLREHTQQIVDSLKNTPLNSQIQMLGGNIINRLNKISESQSLPNASIEQKISNFGVNSAVFEEIKKDIGVLEDLAIEEGGVTGMSAVKGLMGEASAGIDPLMIGYNPLDIQKLGTIKFLIKISMFSDTESPIPLKYFLPTEVKPEYIVDKGGLDLGYDTQKGTHYVYKENIILMPEETKEFTLTIRDVWSISLGELEVLRAHTQKLTDTLEDSEYKEPARFLGERIISSLDNIISVQNTKDITVESHIGNYRKNLKKLEGVRKDIARLERLVIRAGGSVGVTLAPSIQKVKREQGWVAKGGGGFQSSPASGLQMISKTVFRGKAPNISTTWRMIYGIIGFLGSISLLVVLFYIRRRRIIEFDALTGAFRRDSLLAKSAEVVSICQKNKSQCAFFILDMDNFKQLNDTYGHLFGDLALKEFVLIIRSQLRSNDIIGRYGGDEFVVIASDINKQGAMKIAEKIRSTVEFRTLKIQNEEVHLKLSIGVSMYPESGTTVAKLYVAADSALYEAKAAGGNTVHFI
jgi:diguanylate cyclase (GGDEF)-like protein